MAAITEGVQWNYTTVLNLIFLVIAAVLVIRFLRTGGPAMLKMMSMPAHEMEQQEMHGNTGHDQKMGGHAMGNHEMHHHEQSSEQKEMKQ